MRRRRSHCSPRSAPRSTRAGRLCRRQRRARRAGGRLAAELAAHASDRHRLGPLGVGGMDKSATTTEAHGPVTSLARDHWLFSEHVVTGVGSVLPGAALVDLALAAVRRAEEALESIVLVAPVFPGDDVEIVAPRPGVLAIHAGPTRRLVAEASVVTAPAPTLSNIDISTILQRCPRSVDPTPPERDHLELGMRWRCVTEQHQGDGEALAKLLRPRGEDDDDFVLHPAVLDAAIGVGLQLVEFPHSAAARPGDHRFVLGRSTSSSGSVGARRRDDDRDWSRARPDVRRFRRPGCCDAPEGAPGRYRREQPELPPGRAGGFLAVHRPAGHRPFGGHRCARARVADGRNPADSVPLPHRRLA